MSRVDLNFDAVSIYTESVILDNIDIDKLIEYLDGEGYTVEEVDEE